MTMRNSRQSVLSCGVCVVAGLMLLGSVAGTTQAQTWVGPTSGDLLWADSDNWNPGVPNSASAVAVINDVLTGNRTITTPDTGLTIDVLEWTYAATATGVDTIKLGGNMLVDGTSTGASGVYFVINNAGSAANMVIDLNGKTLTMAGANTTTGALLSKPVSIQSTSAGGTIVGRALGTMSPSLQVGPGVIVRAQGTGANSQLAGTWDATSVIQIANETNLHTIRANGSSWSIGNLIIGDSTNDARSVVRFQFENGQVKGDFTILGTTTPGVYSTLDWRGARVISVAGNYTDHAVGNLDYSYADASSRGTIVFNGGALTERTLTIGRTGLTKTGFRVGQDASNPGNVKLGANLTTQDDFTVKTNSRFNVAQYVLNTGTFTGENGTLLAYTFDALDDDGRIDVTGLLTLASNITLDVTALSGPLMNGRTLFTFGSYSGPSDLSTWTITGDVPGGWTAQFLGNSIVLAVPEPGSGAVILVGLMMLYRRRAHTGSLHS